VECPDRKSSARITTATTAVYEDAENRTRSSDFFVKGAKLKGEIGEDTADPTASHSYQ